MPAKKGSKINKTNLSKFLKIEPNSKQKIILKLTSGLSILRDYCQNFEIFKLGLSTLFS